MNENRFRDDAVPPEPSSANQPAGHGVHQLGYRSWNGLRASSATRWLVISAVGVRRSWQSQWLKRMLFFAWLPAVWFGAGFFAWEQAAQYPEWQMFLRPAVQNLPPTPVFSEIAEKFEKGEFADGRHTVWAWLLLSFFRYPQAVLMVMIIGMIAPTLISQDVRSRAFLIYFSRPLTRFEYLLGKLGTLWVYLSLISVIPAVVLYLLGVLLSPNLNVVWATWDLPFRIIAASLVLMLPTSALALCLSSLTQESRYAGFSWFAIWILGWFTYGAARSVETFNAGQASRFGNRAVQLQESVWTHLSLYHTLGRVESWVFGFANLSEVYWSIVILVLATSGSLVVLFYRISAPMRV